MSQILIAAMFFIAPFIMAAHCRYRHADPEIWPAVMGISAMAAWLPLVLAGIAYWIAVQ